MVNHQLKLTNCGGTALLKKSSNQGTAQYNIKTHGLTNCNKFDILESNGSTVIYSAKNIESKDASFTLPKKVVSRGLSFNDPLLDLLFRIDEPNFIKIKFYNSYVSSIRDVIYLYFYDQGNADEGGNNTEVRL